MGAKVKYVFAKGQKFGNLTVVSDLMNGKCLCLCNCGTSKEINKVHLRNGKIVSCGCWNKKKSIKHGMEGTREYNTWASMLSRCRNPNNKFYKDYGGRGIRVCDRWLSFANFYDDMGEKPEGMSIDRIDTNGNYSPENCRWTSQVNQIRNRRVSPKFLWNGEMKSLAELSNDYGLPWRRVYDRMRSGWSIEKALTTPIGNTGPKNEH